MKVKSVFFLICAMLLSVSAVFAGTTGKIVGTVKDKGNGEPLIGVNVVLEGTTLGATTDLDGSYLILNVPPGSYSIVFQYIGYADFRVSGVNVSVDFTTKLNAELEEATVELGETVEVVADRSIIRKDLTSSQAEIGAEQIANIPVEEFEDVLQLQAGVTRNDQGGFHIRGGRSSEVAYWVDGVSVTDAFDGSNAVEVENNAIQSLQVISGTFNAEYGQAMSGIINIVTKEGGSKLSGRVSAYVGDYFTSDGYPTSEAAGGDNIFLNLDEVSLSDIYNFNASLDGPVPLTNDKMRFFVNVRRSYDDGWLYGQRRFVAAADTGIQPESGNLTYLPTPGDGQAVAMNSDSWYSGQANVTYYLTNLVKVRANFNYENREFREYDHFYKFNPDGDFQKFQTGFNTALTLDHTLSSKTFYTAKAAYFKKEFEQYVYEDPTDPRYINGGSSGLTVPSFNFSQGGQKNQHFNRSTTTSIFKVDVNSQIHPKHLVKFGVEGRVHELFFEDFSVIDAVEGDGELFTARPPDVNDPNFNTYTFKPVEFSVYFQDKMEYDDFIVNVGLRFDYFDSKGRVLADPMDPNIRTPFLAANQALTLAEREAIWYEDPDPKFQFSPRVGVAYPISEAANIHFSYGHFLQMPEFRLLYDNPQFNVTRQNGINNLVGNADLDAQRTVMYEIGLQQQLTEDIGVDITGFYRDVRGWVGTSPLKETYATGVLYSQYENRDYANVRGLTLAFKRRFSNNFSANIDYTFQVAEGNASDPTDAFNDAKSNNEPRRSIIPLDWDRTHILNGNVYFGLNGWGGSIIGRFESGLPYTPAPVAGARVGSQLQTGLPENSERRPNLITFDLQFFRDFQFGNLKWTVFAKVFNLLDRRNEQRVFGDSGRATYTLQSINVGQADPEYLIQPDFYTQPRRLQLGLSVDF